MSVELHAPKGYEVQYLVTLWIGLLSELAAPGQASVRVEEKEDAEVSLAIGTSAVRIAVLMIRPFQTRGTWLYV